jgi:hypothetical protein
VRSTSFPLSIQQGSQRFRAPDVTLLCALGSTSQQDNKLATPLGEVHAPSGPDVDSKLGHTVAHRFNVAEKTSFKSLDPGNHTPRIVASAKWSSHAVNSESALTLNAAPL